MTPFHAAGARIESSLGTRSLRRATPTPQSDHRWLEVRGCRVRVQDLGSGSVTLVFAPDPPNVLEHHRPVLEALARDFRVIALELPGFGFSRPSPGFGYTLPENSAIVVEALRTLEARSCVLCLPCVAGLASVLAAAAAPDLVVGVAAIQTPDLGEVLTWSQRVDQKRIARTPVVGQLVVRATRRKLAEQWYRAAAGSSEAARGLTTGALGAYERGAIYGLSTALQQLPQVSGEELGPVDVPAISLWGKRDRTHRRTNPKSLARHLPRLEVAELEDAGHFPDLEDPIEFQRLLTDWISREVA